MWLLRLFDRVSRLQVFVLLAGARSEQSPLFALALSKVNIVTTLRLLVGVNALGTNATQSSASIQIPKKSLSQTC